MQRRPVLGLLALLVCSGTARATDPPPALMLAKVYRPGLPLADYWVSEKYDGVRGYWDGHALFTRSGERIAAPAWFTAGWPAVALDGELWAGRGSFAETVSTVRHQTPDEDAWRRIRFMVFDLPGHGAPFTERLASYQQLIPALAVPWLQAVAQERVASPAVLQQRLHAVIRGGGEGLMLHRGRSHYQALRSDDLLKFKPHEDAEARVVAHLPGQGRHAGRLGALLVETPDGLRFRLGTGFSDTQRQQPPALGRWVSYRYRGTTAAGVPRFASFLRVRDDL